MMALAMIQLPFMAFPHCRRILCRIQKIKEFAAAEKSAADFLREGIRQAEMLAFPFAAAREPAKRAKRVLSG